VTSSVSIASVSARLTSGSWWFRASDGSLTLWQLPNPALWVWAVALVVGRFDLSAAHADTVDGVRHGAQLVWGLDELVRGASPIRRVLGAVILCAQLAGLVLG
jgi:hypothetical protein